MIIISKIKTYTTLPLGYVFCGMMNTKMNSFETLQVVTQH
jgi:hypothetical protein